MYPVLKENKIFSWETFPLCFSFPHFLLLLLSPGLSSRVSTVSFSLETPPGALSCGSDFPWGPGCMEAGTPLHAIYADFTSPSWAEGGSEGGRLAAGPRVSHSSLSASCAFLLSQPSRRSIQQAPATPWACLCQAALCLESLLLPHSSPGKIRPGTGWGPGFQLPLLLPASLFLCSPCTLHLWGSL